MGLLFWYAAGILLLGHLFRLTGYLRLSLTTILVWSCLLILAPPLLQSLVNFEGGDVEREARLERDARTTLGRVLQSESEAFLQIAGFTGNLLRTHVRQPPLVRGIDSPAPPSSDDFTSSATEHLKARLLSLLPRGGLVQYAYIFGPNGPIASYMDDPTRARNLDRFQKLGSFYGQLYREFLRRLDPNSARRQSAKEQRESMGFWLQFEEVLTLITWVFPTESFLEMILSPGTFVQADFFVNQSTFAHIPLYDRGQPRLVFHSSCQRDALSPNFLREFSEARHRFEQVDIRIWPAWYDSSYLALRPPYQIIELGRILSGKHEFPYPQWPEMGRLAGAAFSQRGPVFGERLQGHERQLLGAIKSDNCESFAFCAALPLGTVLDESASRQRMVRWVLAGVVFSALLLAWMVSRLVLRPIRDLTGAVRQVTGGNFSVLLPTQSRDEVGQLNQAFNQMVRGVRERQRLARFLSDSVRTAVQEEDVQAGIASASTKVVTVLFAGISGLRDKRHRLSPQQLMLELNQLIERLTATVIAAQGVVDKIMGDKLLAVFYPAPHESPAQAVARALQAAERLLQAAHSLPAWQQERLGIGLVTGPVISGILGTPEIRLEMTVIGDTVNLASRLCDVALQLPDGGVVSEPETRQALERVFVDDRQREFRRLAVSKVKGKSREVEVFQIRV